MKKLTLICLINIFLVAMTGISSEAKVSIGLSTSVLSAKATQANITSLEKALSTASGDEVEIRQFKDDLAVTNWLLRFQQIDAAIVPADFIRQQPAGSLSHLVDVHLPDKSKRPLALTTRFNLDRTLQDRISGAFLSLSKSDSGSRMLSRLGFAGTTRPGAEFVRKTVKKVQPEIVKTAPMKKVETTSSELEQEATSQPARISGKSAPEPETTAKAEDVPAPPVTKEPETTAKAEEVPESPVTTEPEAPEAAESQQLAIQPEPKSKPSETTKSLPPSESGKEKDTDITRGEESAPKKQEMVAKPVEKAESEQTQDRRITLFIVLIIIAAILLKVVLITLRWQNKKRKTQEHQQTPTIDEPVRAEINEAAQPVEQPDVSQFVIEEGNLGPGKVPELLKRCADLPKPVILKAQKGNSEKLIYFAGGQVCAAYTYNAEAESEVRWNKLGSLLVREKLITSEERDQGMSLVSRETGLRLGEALLKLGLIDLKDLRHALTRQAKVTIYSLILFPEGHYQVIDEVSSLPAEENISLEVISLIREASHHQSEWKAIRQTLPNLNKKLQFSAHGHEKLEKVDLAPQQETTLALVDGNRTINDLCAESSMLDYEVYRFLYLMVKTGVLE